MRVRFSPAAFFLLLLVAAVASGLARADEAQSFSESQAQPVYLLQPGAKATALPRVVLQFDPAVSTLRVPPPPQLELLQKGLMEKQATVTVNYLPAGPGSGSDTCIAWPEQAKTAFAFAANLWALQLQSAVPVTIDACWSNNLASGVLGHAGANNFLRNFPEAPASNTWYPVALANALSGRDFDAGDSDLYAAFSSTFNWYFGTDGNTPSSQLDFVSVLLHEIGHGLGFLGSMRVSNGEGSWGAGSGFPFIYDRYTENGSGQPLINTALFANPSAALAAQLQSNAVFFDAANAKAANGGARVPLFAPSTWRSGSSYSHLAESFNDTPNALMTFALRSGESIHSPGPIMLGMFKDMGWPLSTPPGNFTLTVSKDGTGGGTVTSLPAGIDCGATCSASFASGTAVTLTASVLAGATFAGWNGGGCSGTGICTVTMNAATSVVATFSATAPTSFKLSVSLSGAGSGTVTSSPAGISCGLTCSAGFDSGTRVTLVATAVSSSVFSSWSGACTGTGTCLVTMDAAKSVTAIFGTAPTSLTSGQAVVNLSAVVDESRFYYIDVPTGAAALTVQTFGGSGDVDLYVRRDIEPSTTSYDCRSSNTGTAENCFFAGLTAARYHVLLNATGGYSGVSLQATYSLAGIAHTLTVSKTGSGSGLVTSSPSGVNCGPACAGVFNTGTAVTLTAVASGGSTFGGWSGGGCSGTGACKVTLGTTTTVTATFDAVPVIARLSNLSTRGQVQSGDNRMIGGFIISGAAPKKVLVTARGPSLAAFGVAGAMANPSLQLVSGQTVIASNDDFGTASNASEIQATGKAPTNALESAILTTLNPGAYTAIVSGVNGGTGVGIVEVFEIDRPDIPLTNLSTRGQVQTGDNVIIGGFVIEGTQPKTVLIRANGPSLTAFGVQGALANPSLRINSGQTVIAANDDWQSASNATAIQATGLAPTNPLESALLMTLNPGAYTAIVSGVNGGTGVGIVEVFAK